MKNILQKIHNIQAQVEQMEKQGTNTFQNYKYLTEAQITNQLKNLMDHEGVVFNFSAEILSAVPFQTAKGGSTLLTTVRVSYSFIDVTTGEEFKGSVDGQGSDSGDKGVYKAITGAIKYVYMKTFNIPTGDDPEKDSRKKKVGTINQDKPPFGPGSDIED